MFESLFATLGTLPVSKILKKVAAKVLAGTVVVVASDTGSGKTLLLPPALAAQTDQPVLVLEPRRFLAVNAAETVAELAQVAVGGPVGYAVGRQSGEESRWSADGKILYCTYGYAIASNLILTAPIVVLDEVHEVSLDMSICRALLYHRVEQGQQVCILEMSATINADAQAAYWRPVAKVMVEQVDGRTFACERRYRPGSPLEKEVKTLLDEGRTGILVFRPGRGEVKETADAIRALVGKDVEVAEVYGELDYASRKAAVAPPVGKAKVLVGTNVVESGANIPWLDAGVSCGTGKENSVRIETGAVFLKLIDLPQWRIKQQEGRVKRFRDGIFVLCSDVPLESREVEAVPEIWRLPLTALALHCATFGIRADDLTYDFAPEKARIVEAETKLQRLGLMDADFQLTAAGTWVSELPIGPETGTMLWFAKQTQCLGAALPLAAVIEVDGIWEDVRQPHGLHKDSDWLDTYTAFRTVLSASESRRAALVTRHNISLKRFEAAQEMLRDLDRRLDAEATATLEATDAQLKLCLVAGFITSLCVGTHTARQVVGTSDTAYKVGQRSVVAVPFSGYVTGQLRTIQPKDTTKQSFTVLEKVTDVAFADLLAVAKVCPWVLTVEERREQAGYFAFRQVARYRLFGVYLLAETSAESPLTPDETTTQDAFEQERARLGRILQTLTPLRAEMGMGPIQLRREVFYLDDAAEHPYAYTDADVARAKAETTAALDAHRALTA